MKKLRISGGIGVDYRLPDNPELAAIMSRVLSNIVRVNALVSLYESIRAFDHKPRGRSNIHLTEILRSTVVLMHAALEDGLRGLLRFRMPRTKEAFDAIPLAGLNEVGRPEKFLLGELARFRGKTVDEVWDASLEAHLCRQSFNDTTDVARALRTCRIDLSEVESLMKPLSEMIRRRHHIVHNADINEKKGHAGHQFARSIGAADIKEWNDAIFVLFTTIVIQVTSERSERAHG